MLVVAAVKGELGSKVVAGSSGRAGAGSGVGILGGGEYGRALPRGLTSGERFLVGDRCGDCSAEPWRGSRGGPPLKLSRLEKLPCRRSLAKDARLEVDDCDQRCRLPTPSRMGLLTCSCAACATVERRRCVDERFLSFLCASGDDSSSMGGSSGGAAGRCEGLAEDEALSDEARLRVEEEVDDRELVFEWEALR